jgi:pimeloyl-ACP methyl ester carboxylesterase
VSQGAERAPIEVKEAGGLAYREVVPAQGGDADPVLLVHGFPQSSYMWRHLMPELATAGRTDDYVPVANAHRFGEVIPGAKVVVLEDVGHFVWEDEPERCAREVVSFLERSGAGD